MFAIGFCDAHTTFCSLHVAYGPLLIYDTAFLHARNAAANMEAAPALEAGAIVAADSPRLARRATARDAAPQHGAPRPSTERRATARRTAPRNSTARRAAARRAAPQHGAPRHSTGRRAAARRAAPQHGGPRCSAPGGWLYRRPDVGHSRLQMGSPKYICVQLCERA